MKGISGSSRMEIASDDDEGEEEEEDEGEDEDEVEIVEAKPKKKPVASKKPPAKATSNYKSAAKITTSDDESGAEERRDRASKKARVTLESDEDESNKGKVKVEKKPKEKAEKKPKEKAEKKPRARAVKPGDAERGTAEEEEKIKQLKVSTSLHSSAQRLVADIGTLTGEMCCCGQSTILQRDNWRGTDSHCGGTNLDSGRHSARRWIQSEWRSNAKHSEVSGSR